MHWREPLGPIETDSVDESFHTMSTGTSTQLELPHVVTVSKGGALDASSTALVLPSGGGARSESSVKKRSTAIESPPTLSSGGAASGDAGAHELRSTSADAATISGG